MPRPRKPNPLVAGSAGAIGALLAGPMGAAMGAGLGALLSTEPPPLEEALAEYLRDRGLELVSVRSPSRLAVTVVFKTGDRRYSSVAVSVPGSTAREQIDDQLYDAAVREFNAHVILRERRAAQ